MTLDLDQFDAFRVRYLRVLQSLSDEIVSAFKQDYSRFCIRSSAFQDLARTIDRYQAGSFNVFTTLGLGHKEVQTHTPFLRELLDRRGTHGQGDLFLRLFLQVVLKYSADQTGDMRDWHVIKEENNVDLKLINYKKNLAIFIENKIYSEAHDEQLSRYYALWKDGYFGGRGEFIYLSVKGIKPADEGFARDAKYGRDQIERDLRLFSYKEHVKDWLTAALPEIKAPGVIETVTQYLELINTL